MASCAQRGATTAASVTYLVPLFSTLLGVLVLSEELLWHEPVGALVVLAGVAVSQTGARTPAGIRAVSPLPARGSAGRS